jgi:hypothetical protein
MLYKQPKTPWKFGFINLAPPSVRKVAKDFLRSQI